jgi:hypothetical protein
MSETDLPHGEVLKASSPGAGQIEVGMDVLGVDGQTVGRVKEVRADDFLVDRPMARDVYVPYKFVLSVPEKGDKALQGNDVLLTVSAAHVDSQGWQQP